MSGFLSPNSNRGIGKITYFQMKQLWAKYTYLCVAIPIVLVLLCCELFLSKENNRENESSRVYEILEKKEQSVDHLIKAIADCLAANPNVSTDWSLLQFGQKSKEGIEIAVLSERGLNFWSSSSIAFPSENCIRKFELVRIYNRWGNSVFESTNRKFRWYAPEQPAGVYYFLIKFTDKEYKGSISVRF